MDRDRGEDFARTRETAHLDSRPTLVYALKQSRRHASPSIPPEDRGRSRSVESVRSAAGLVPHSDCRGRGIAHLRSEVAVEAIEISSEKKAGSAGHLKSTISFLQQKDNPYTLRCTPLSYEIVPHPLKEKGESKVTSKMDGAEETPTVDVDRAQNR
ncbi:hypothetical protein V8G54_000254 (mitochondrion) [Vigna mungo]|uniref:Uncharacterized protein n=1 Tax=Vigna mungo TaxID=3915 RepID=A0AAQ3PEG3_VIGMU